jgi:hypothetical protein
MTALRTGGNMSQKINGYSNIYDDVFFWKTTVDINLINRTGLCHPSPPKQVPITTIEYTLKK